MRGGESALAVSAWPLRRKMSLALAIPLLLAGTLGGLRVHGDLVTSSNSSASARQVSALRPAVAYLTAAEKATVAAVGTDAASKAALAASVDDLRGAGDRLRAAKDSARLTPAQADQVDAVLDLSQAMRDDEALQLSAGTWQAGLRQLQSGVTQLITTIVDAQLTPEPKLDLLSQALAGRFSLAMEQALAAGDRSGETGSTELYSELGAEGAAIDRLASGLGTDQRTVASLRTANAERFRTVRVGHAKLGGAEAYGDYDTTITSLQGSVDQELAAAADAARRAALVSAAVTVAALIAAVALAYVVSLLLLRPIRRVREGALAVAREQLPDEVARIRSGEEPGDITPIGVRTGEEIGQLARAVDDLHRQAVVLASGEAALRSQVSQMFVTLSRRNTSLINQQLSQIERLERDEEDPKRLESLFQLDHLAARMRRTADSLLILADAPTASAVVEGLTVSDALQAATSGVQDYQRVRIRSAEAIAIRSDAAADVMHLLTELVDNALAFSPPTSAVDVSTSTTGRGLVVEISDAGLGIAAAELMRLNHTLSSGGEVTPETARRMGLFVVSRLSQRHGILTTLRGNKAGGTTAIVLLPRVILPGLTASGPAGPVEEERRTPEIVEPPRVTPDRPLSLVHNAPAGPPPDQSDVETRISAALGLPTRTRGAAPTPSAPIHTAAGSAVPPAALPQRAARHEEVMTSVETPETVVPGSIAALRPTTTPEPPTADVPGPADAADAADAEPVSLAAVPERAATPVVAAEPVVADAPVAPEPIAAAAPVRLVSSNALDADWSDPGGEDDSPIFRQLRSAWFSGDESSQPWRTTEIEAGWEKAEEVVEVPVAAEVSESGLPMRRPGTRLVPGGVEPTPILAVRDPAAIRARLAAHSSGVARGRRDAANADTESR